ncbi:unnamed protein product [Paramecium primaurelia]|uniref:G domain-containing protein n=1 Tax=Paramecium primaurelia TaxID=5886 RepID=A0A8S1QMX9_PARPR|nr:unnamed protein product [Paramecium primaurelia]
MKQMDSSNQTQIQEIYKLSCTFNTIWRSIQQQISDEKTIIVILLGSQNSGKTTFLKYLKQDDLNIVNKSKDILNSNKQEYFDIFKIDSTKPHLFLDLNSILNSEKNNMILIFEELILRLIDKYEIKLIYILEHPDNELLHRGSQLKEFIQKYLGGNQINLQILHIILNKYFDNLNDEELNQTVQQEIQDMNLTYINEIFVFRKIKTMEQQQIEFSIEKRENILNSIIKQRPLKLKRDQFTLNEKLVYSIQEIFKSTSISIIKKIQEINKKASRYKQSYLKKLKEQYQTILNDTQNKDPQFLFDQSKEWDQLINDNFSNNDLEFNNYHYLKDILPQFTNIIEKIKILEDINRMVQNCCQVIIQNLETYINEDYQQHNNIIRKNMAEIKSDSIENEIKKYESLQSIQLEELDLIVNDYFVEQPCEKTRKLKIALDIFLEYRQKLEKLNEKNEEIKKQPQKKKQQSSCQIQ